MLSCKHSEAVNNIIELFKESGYELHINVVNAKDYGVAQERKRVFYIGFRKDINVDFQFPTGSTSSDEDKITIRDVIQDLQETVMAASENNKHNPKAINNNEYFVGSYSPMFMSRNRVKD